MTPDKRNKGKDKNFHVKKGLKKAGVYQLVNKYHKVIYVGKSLDLDQREQTHKGSLLRGTSEITKLQEHYFEIESKGERAFDYIKFEEIDVTVYNLNTDDIVALEEKYANLEKDYLLSVVKSGEKVYNIRMLESYSDNREGILLQAFEPFMKSSTSVDDNLLIKGDFNDVLEKNTVYATDEEATFILLNSIIVNTNKACKIGKKVYISVNRAAENEKISDSTVIERINLNSP